MSIRLVIPDSVAHAMRLPGSRRQQQLMTELALTLYGFVTSLLAIQRAPALVPFILIYTAGFGFTALIGFWQSRGIRLMKNIPSHNPNT